MRIPTSQTERLRSAAGFTLVELLAVLAILAIAVVAISYGGNRSIDSAQFRALMVRTAASIREARSQAIRAAGESVFIVDLGRRRMGDRNGGEGLAIPREVDVTAEVAASEQYRDGSLGIRFYSNGSSTGGTLRFVWRGQTYRILVNWLTGNVSMGHG
jgi:general secretion pathway protein H